MGELNTAEWASFLRSQSASSPHPAALAPVGSLRQQEVGRGQKEASQVTRLRGVWEGQPALGRTGLQDPFKSAWILSPNPSLSPHLTWALLPPPESPPRLTP